VTTVTSASPALRRHWHPVAWSFELGDGPIATELRAEQDRPIIESQDRRELPLVLAEELHLLFDRVAIAYRRALRPLEEQT
jgi:hypothetical protein